MLRRLLLLLLVATPAVAGSRVTASLDGPSPPAALLSSLEALAAACERGDRRALIDLISPEHRAEVQALADTLLSSTTTPLTDVRIELVRWDEPQATGSLLLTARAPIRRAGGATTIAPPDGFVPATPGSAGRSLAFERFPSGLLALRDGHGAGVRHLDAELRLEPKPPRILGRVTEDLDGEPVVAFLEMASGTFVRSLSQDVRVTPLDQVLGRPSSSAVRVEWLPGARRGRVEFESVALLDRNSVQGEIIALLHQSQAIPFATTGHFTADVILDAPLPSRPVSVGTEEELPAEPGRRRVRFRWDPLESTCRHASLSIL